MDSTQFKSFAVHVELEPSLVKPDSKKVTAEDESYALVA